jgi:5-methylcytosine-specific restriction enzyme subunit McrC
LLDSLQIDRKTSAYERALELAKLIILNYSPDINQGKQQMISILFDMNILWEEYVLQILRIYANQNPAEQWFVRGQEPKPFYASYRSIRPDIVLRKGTIETFVIDTKWKRPNNNSASIEDLRQMYTYGRFWKTNKLVLLYPGLAFDSGYLPYPNKNDHDSDFHQCKTLFVNILEGDKIDTNLAFKIIQHLNN